VRELEFTRVITIPYIHIFIYILQAYNTDSVCMYNLNIYLVLNNADDACIVCL
jgi:hypothetical protein